MDAPATPPLYRQVSDLIVRQIASGELIAGERLPPERRLALDHGVAVGTLRRALDDLVAEGLIERRHGSGNYVRGIRDIGGLYGFFRLERPEGPGIPGARLMSFDTGPKPADTPDFGPSTRAHRIRRLRLIDDEAVALEEIFLDESAAPALSAATLGPSLYRTYRTEAGLRIIRVEDRVSVAAPPAWDPGHMDAGRAAGYVTRLSWEARGHPVEYSRTWFDPGRVSYVNRHK